MRCKATNRHGERCRTPPHLVNDTGLCYWHRLSPEELKEVQRRGGRVAQARARRGLPPDELPPLDSPQAAEAWLEAVGRAVASGRLGHNEAKAVVSAVQQWLRAHEAGAVSERVEQLREQLQELQRGKLQAVK